MSLGMAFLVLLLGIIPAQEIPIMPLSSIQQDKIGKTATVEGRIVNVLSPRSEKAPYTIYLTDEKDTLVVVIWADVFKAISGADKLKPGVKVRMTGTVKDYRNNLQFNINKAQDVVLLGENAEASETKVAAVSAPVSAQPQAPGVLSPSQIDRSHIDQRVVVQGQVKEFKPSWNDTAPYSITLQDASGTLRIVYWSDVAKILGPSWAPRTGQTLRIRGKVSDYRGNLQLKVNEAGDIVDVAASQASAPAMATPVLSQISPGESPFVSLGSLTKEYIGRTVRIKGKVVDATPSKQSIDPFRVAIMDDTGVFLAVYWSSVDEKLTSDQKPVVGKDFEFEGQVIEHKGEIQLLVIDPQKISPSSALSKAVSESPSTPDNTLTPASRVSAQNPSGSESNPMILSINKITQEYVGKYVRVTGTIEKITPAWQPTAPHTIILTDEKGKINVVYWADVADSLQPEQKPQAGQAIQVQGKVKEFKGELQIKIYKATHIVPLKSASVPINVSPVPEASTKPISQPPHQTQERTAQNPLLPLGSVSREYLSKYVKVQGKIAEITPSWMPSAPNIVILSDGHAKIRVVYWSDVADKLTPQQKPAIDAVLMVEGKLDEYRGELQIKVEKPENINLVK